MTRRRLALVLIGFALAAVAWSSVDSEQAATTAGATTASPTTTTTAAPTTSSTPPSPSTTTTQAPDAAVRNNALAGRGDLAGLGDSLYPLLGNGGYDAVHYDVEITVAADSPTITGVTTIEAVALQDLTTFNLDFGPFDIAEVTVDGVTARHGQEDLELTVQPETALSAADRFEVRVEYAGQPQPVQSQAIRFEVGWRTASNGTRYVVSEPDGASSWFPSNNHPLDKATYTIAITAPAPLLAVANGTLVETITDVGANTYIYEMAQPMASYLATVAIGELTNVEDAVATADAGVPIRNVLPPNLAATPPAVLERQGEMLAFLESVYGPYPFDVYGIAVVPEFPAALENQTLSIFGDGIVDLPVFEFVLVHELAHQWFGDHVSPADWSDIWLNEGFATYGEWLWLEHNEGPEALATITAGNREAMASAELPPPGSPPADDLFNSAVYRRGGLTLHALRLEIGDDAFFSTLRTYVERFGGSAARTADFIATAEEISGQQLDDLFDAWLYAEAVPEL